MVPSTISSPFFITYFPLIAPRYQDLIRNKSVLIPKSMRVHVSMSTLPPCGFMATTASPSDTTYPPNNTDQMLLAK